MDTICGANCAECGFKATCKGCAATCGSPFGGRCVAAEFIKIGGREAYDSFKQSLLGEINALLSVSGLPKAGALYELPGAFVNLAYPLPGGEAVKFLDDRNIYLGVQIPLADLDVCCGVVADTTFILICRYGPNGSDPELVAYQKR